MNQNDLKTYYSALEGPSAVNLEPLVEESQSKTTSKANNLQNKTIKKLDLLSGYEGLTKNSTSKIGDKTYMDSNKLYNEENQDTLQEFIGKWAGERQVIKENGHYYMNQGQGRIEVDPNDVGILYGGAPVNEQGEQTGNYKLGYITDQGKRDNAVDETAYSYNKYANDTRVNPMKDPNAFAMYGLKNDIKQIEGLIHGNKANLENRTYDLYDSDPETPKSRYTELYKGNTGSSVFGEYKGTEDTRDLLNLYSKEEQLAPVQNIQDPYAPINYGKTVAKSSIANGLAGMGYMLGDGVINTLDLAPELVEYAYKNLTGDKYVNFSDTKGLYSKKASKDFQDWIGYNDEVLNELGQEAVVAAKDAYNNGDYFGVLKVLGKGIVTPEVMLPSLGYVIGMALPGRLAASGVRAVSKVEKNVDDIMKANSSITKAEAVAKAEEEAGTGYKVAKAIAGDIGYIAEAEQFSRDAQDTYREVYGEEMPAVQALLTKPLGFLYAKLNAIVDLGILKGVDPVSKGVKELIKKADPIIQNKVLASLAVSTGMGVKVAGAMGIEGATEGIQTAMEEVAGRYKDGTMSVPEVLEDRKFEILSAGIIGASGGAQLNIAGQGISGLKGLFKDRTTPESTPTETPTTPETTNYVEATEEELVEINNDLVALKKAFDPENTEVRNPTSADIGTIKSTLEKIEDVSDRISIDETLTTEQQKLAKDATAKIKERVKTYNSLLIDLATKEDDTTEIKLGSSEDAEEFLFNMVEDKKEDLTDEKIDKFINRLVIEDSPDVDLDEVKKDLKEKYSLIKDMFGTHEEATTGKRGFISASIKIAKLAKSDNPNPEELKKNLEIVDRIGVSANNKLEAFEEIERNQGDIITDLTNGLTPEIINKKYPDVKIQKVKDKKSNVNTEKYQITNTYLSAKGKDHKIFTTISKPKGKGWEVENTHENIIKSAQAYSTYIDKFVSQHEALFEEVGYPLSVENSNIVTLEKGRTKVAKKKIKPLQNKLKRLGVNKVFVAGEIDFKDREKPAKTKNGKSYNANSKKSVRSEYWSTDSQNTKINSKKMGNYTNEDTVLVVPSSNPKKIFNKKDQESLRKIREQGATIVVDYNSIPKSTTSTKTKEEIAKAAKETFGIRKIFSNSILGATTENPYAEIEVDRTTGSKDKRTLIFKPKEIAQVENEEIRAKNKAYTLEETTKTKSKETAVREALDILNTEGLTALDSLERLKPETKESLVKYFQKDPESTNTNEVDSSQFEEPKQNTEAIISPIKNYFVKTVTENLTNKSKQRVDLTSKKSIMKFVEDVFTNNDEAMDFSGMEDVINIPSSSKGRKDDLSSPEKIKSRVIDFISQAVEGQLKERKLTSENKAEPKNIYSFIKAALDTQIQKNAIVKFSPEENMLNFINRAIKNQVDEGTKAVLDVLEDDNYDSFSDKDLFLSNLINNEKGDLTETEVSIKGLGKYKIFKNEKIQSLVIDNVKRYKENIIKGTDLLKQWKDYKESKDEYDSGGLSNKLDELGLKEGGEIDFILENTTTKGMEPRTKTGGKVYLNDDRTESVNFDKSNKKTRVAELDLNNIVEKKQDTPLNSIETPFLGSLLNKISARLNDTIKKTFPTNKQIMDSKKKADDANKKRSVVDENIIYVDNPARAILFNNKEEVNSNVALAMKIAINEYYDRQDSLLTGGYIDASTVANLLGIDENSVTSNMIKEIKERGVLRKTVSSSIGKSVAQLLGIGRNTSLDLKIDAQNYDTLIADLGSMALLIEEAEGNIVRTPMNIKKYSELFLENQKTKNIVNKEADIYFIKSAKGKDNFKVTEINKGLESFSKIKEIFPEAVTLETKPFIGETSKEINKRVEKQLNKGIRRDRTETKIPEKSKKTLAKLMKMDWGFNRELIQQVLETDNRNILKQRLGYIQEFEVDDEGELTENLTEKFSQLSNSAKEAQVSKNRDIERSFDELDKLISDYGDNPSFTTTLRFNWFFAKNGRFMLESNTINPQTDKHLHRWFVKPISHLTKFTVSGTNFKDKNGNSLNKQVKYSLAQAFGFATDKKYTKTVNELGTALLDVDKKELQSIKDWILKTTDKEYEFKYTINGEEKTFELEVEHLGHMLEAIEFLQKYKELDGKTGTFKSTLSAEFDAVTSGFGLKILMLPILENVTDYLQKIGLVPNSYFKKNKDIAKSMNDVLESGTKDMYQTLAIGMGDDSNKAIMDGEINIDDIEEYLSEKFSVFSKSTLLPKNVKVQTSYIKSLDTLWKDLKGSLPQVEEDGVVTSALRSLFKSPFMVFNYAAGMKGIRSQLAKNISSTLIDEILVNYYKEAKDQNKELNKILLDLATGYAKSINQEPDNTEEVKKLLEDYIELLQIKPLSQIDYAVANISVEKALESIVDMKYGSVINSILETEFAPLIEANKTINDSFSTMFHMFQVMYKNKIQEKLKDKGMVTVGDLKEIMNDPDIRAVFPHIKSPLGENSDEDGIPIYDTNSASPDSDLVTREAAQTYANKQLLGKNKTLKTWHEIKEFDAAVKAGSVIPVHYLDGSAMSETMRQLSGIDLIGIHDAIIPPISNMFTATEVYNKNVIDLINSFNIMEELQNSLIRAQKVIDKQPILIKKEINKSVVKTVYEKEGREYKPVDITVADSLKTLEEDLYNIIGTINLGREAVNKVFKDGGIMAHMAGMEEGTYEIKPGELIYKNSPIKTREFTQETKKDKEKEVKEIINNIVNNFKSGFEITLKKDIKDILLKKYKKSTPKYKEFFKENGDFKNNVHEKLFDILTENRIEIIIEGLERGLKRLEGIKGHKSKDVQDYKTNINLLKELVDKDSAPIKVKEELPEDTILDSLDDKKDGIIDSKIPPICD